MQASTGMVSTELWPHWGQVSIVVVIIIVGLPELPWL
jgi:hypothetical protein